MLNDIHYSVEQRESKRHEGFGFALISNLRTDVF